ncbi:MAG: nicotinate-nucleotide adenylyltransferase [Rhodobacteraceae bacterium]|nr:nicotinate-nucleotide adenylyltransferase [Paracoccaceae bacterium]
MQHPVPERTEPFFRRSGTRIGLLGGSFDPPHLGHVHITKRALKRFKLDRVWWLVSPGNPLKPNPPASMEKRMAACREIMQHPRVKITNIEVTLKTRYTAETIKKLQARYPGVKFVWLMGADNLAQFHKWQHWQWIAENIPIGVMARPGEQLRAGLSPMARRYAQFRLPASQAGVLPLTKPPCWALLGGPMRDISSSEIRSNGEWP